MSDADAVLVPAVHAGHVLLWLRKAVVGMGPELRRLEREVEPRVLRALAAGEDWGDARAVASRELFRAVCEPDAAPARKKPPSFRARRQLLLAYIEGRLHATHEQCGPLRAAHALACRGALRALVAAGVLTSGGQARAVESELELGGGGGRGGPGQVRVRRGYVAGCMYVSILPAAGQGQQGQGQGQGPGLGPEQGQDPDPHPPSNNKAETCRVWPLSGVLAALDAATHLCYVLTACGTWHLRLRGADGDLRETCTLPPPPRPAGGGRRSATSTSLQCFDAFRRMAGRDHVYLTRTLPPGGAGDHGAPDGDGDEDEDGCTNTCLDGDVYDMQATCPRGAAVACFEVWDATWPTADDETWPDATAALLSALTGTS